LRSCDESLEPRRIRGVTKCLGVLALALALTACAGSHSTVSRAGQAMRYVDTHGIEVAVPASWPLGDGVCGTPKANTVLWNTDAIPACLTNQPRGLSVVEFSGSLRRLHGYRRDTTPVTIDGVRARRWEAGTVMGSEEVRLDFAHRNLSVTVLSPDRSLLGRILASVRPIRVDLDGCPTHPGGVFTHGSRQGASKPFVPAEARRVVGCSYEGRWLDHSNLVGPRAARHLARAFEAAPFGFSHAPRRTILPSICGSTWRGSSITARFEYAGRRPVTITAHLEGCGRLGASNGRWGIRLRPWWVGLLTRDARYFGAMVDPHSVD
jgi:hypothetical protein